MRSPRKAWVSPEVLDQIIALGRAEAPAEACGIVTPDLRVVSLPNCTPTEVTGSYVLGSDDLVGAIEYYVDRSGVEPQSLTRTHFIIWHTHPSGQIGPSKGDLDTRLPDFQYLVVTIPGGEAAQF